MCCICTLLAGKIHIQSQKNSIFPILCSTLCNEETWPLKEKQQINPDLSLHTDHT